MATRIEIRFQSDNFYQAGHICEHSVYLTYLSKIFIYFSSQASSTKSIQADWNLKQINQGLYEIIYVTKCIPSKLAMSLPDATISFSKIIKVNIDLTPPSVLGTPEPMGSDYAFPKTFSIAFTEDIDCSQSGKINITVTSNLTTLSMDDISYSCTSTILNWNFAASRLSTV